MRNGASSLPIIHSNERKRASSTLTKKCTFDSRGEKIDHSQCMGTKFLQSIQNKSKLVGEPYRQSLRTRVVPKSTKMSESRRRLVSFKIIRVRELQNQLCDAQYHLTELANENRLLKTIQKRHELALRRYEGAHAELPRIIKSHHDELRVINMRFKHLQTQEKYACNLLKEKEKEIYTLQAQNKYLLKLNNDRHLEEREKLQKKVSNLKNQIEEREKIIATLSKNLILGDRRLQYKFGCEMSKHKETKTKLKEALQTLKNVEQELANKEKLLYNSRLPAFNKRKKITSQSLSNLQDNSFTSNFINPFSNSKALRYMLTTNSLPKLPGSDPDESRITIPKSNSSENAGKSETMASLEQIKNFRLPKSGHSQRSSISGRSSHEEAEESDTKLDDQSNFIAKSSRSNSLNNFNNNANTPESEENEEIKNITQGLAKRTIDAKYHVPNELMREAGYSFSDNDTNDENNKEEKVITPTSRSRSLHKKLVNGYISSPNATEENINSELQNPKQEINNHQSISNNEQVGDLVKDNLNADNYCDNKVNGIKSEKIEEDIQTSNEANAYINSPKSNTGDTNTKKNNNEGESTGEISWTLLQEKNKKEENFDLLFDFPQLDFKQKPPNSDNVKIIDDDDELLQYFNKNRYADVKNERTDDKQAEPKPSANLKQSQKSDLSTPVCNKNLKLEEKNLNEAAGPSNECKDVKVQESKSIKFGKKEKANSSPKKNSANGLQEKNSDKKISNFNKQKLLAAMKAIDDNQNIEYPARKKSSEFTSRSQVTENLHRGLPTHTTKKDRVFRNIFGLTTVTTNVQSGCSKLH